MRPVLYGDLHAAARRLSGLSAGERAGALAEMLYRAHCADRFRRRTGRGHPEWGNGSLLMAAGTGWPDPACPVTEAAYLEALSSVALGILDWRRARRGRGDGPEGARAV
jgi:hypothetical protein